VLADGREAAPSAIDRNFADWIHSESISFVPQESAFTDHSRATAASFRHTLSGSNAAH
jgi:hypothetical protein